MDQWHLKIVHKAWIDFSSFVGDKDNKSQQFTFMGMQNYMLNRSNHMVSYSNFRVY